MSRRHVSIIAAIVLAWSAAASAQDKGGEDETGAYEVVENWPQPWSPAGYVWGSQPAVFAQSADRIFIGSRGELKAPDPLPRGFKQLRRAHAEVRTVEGWRAWPAAEAAAAGPPLGSANAGCGRPPT